MDDVLETIHIALTGATSLLRRISTGNIRLVPAPKIIMEAAMDAINTLTDDTVVPTNVPYRGSSTLFRQRRKSCLKTTQILFQICVKVMEL